MQTRQKNNRKQSRGRPRKFTDSSRPVTVTLPEHTLQQLAAIDKDRARAIVKSVDFATGSGTDAPNPVELIEVASGKAIIVVGPSKALRTISWLKMIEITPTRYLLALPSGKAIESLEVTIRDLIENRKDAPEGPEKALLEELCKDLGKHRRSEKVTRGELLFVEI
ncbi:MAG: hypothetical protein A2269_00190 [Lentisphaerae bacterium RIFOXYA12_FULL_60_10]|nr:MAG: hypothetical protein A2269_00190 [Lentisphaerae bacterium RIFOXYA12_FULL_60_10]